MFSIFLLVSAEFARNWDFLCSRLRNESRCLHNKGHNPLSWSSARQLNCFVFHFFVSKLIKVFLCCFWKATSGLLHSLRQTLLLCGTDYYAEYIVLFCCSLFLGRLMIIGSVKLDYWELVLERQYTKAYKVIKILSSDSFSACPKYVWDYFYSLHNDLL